MKKLIILFLLLLLSLSTLASAAEPQIYRNDQFGFSVTIPDEFKATPFQAPFCLKAYTNQKIFLQLRYIDPQDNYSASNFAKTPKSEIEGFFKRQRLVSALNTPRFGFINSDSHKSGSGLPYVWGMWAADTQVGESVFKTYLLRNYFLNKNVIVEFDFIIPEEELRASTKLVDTILASLKFDQPAL